MPPEPREVAEHRHLPERRKDRDQGREHPRESARRDEQADRQVVLGQPAESAGAAPLRLRRRGRVEVRQVRPLPRRAGQGRVGREERLTSVRRRADGVRALYDMK